MRSSQIHAANPAREIKRVGRHYMDLSHENNGIEQHPYTSKSTRTAAVHAIVLKNL